MEYIKVGNESIRKLGTVLNDPEYILAHEIAGHAEPRLNDKGDGKTVNAVEVENIIRKETNAKERREEPNHVQ